MNCSKPLFYVLLLLLIDTFFVQLCAYDTAAEALAAQLRAEEREVGETSAAQAGYKLSSPNPNNPKEQLYSQIPVNVEGINNLDERGNTPLINAIIHGHLEALTNVIKGIVSMI
jgi:hypothetical protein